ncbi:MAG: DsrE/DsrF/TusD sulfur relay family protein [Pseudothermotoga sp.]|uniref:DsrE/DsrF/TusD sulfur relay family protein n=1 Tax=Pseudothermotoga sp. TaxID=2033661 RepID=UPI0019AE06FB|nr:DsrE/DsrF/TusD sulfur relay family protein [Pseudothermotoga sp.]MBC7122230.1 DsrE family protein [Pseudothermotoga sp.]MDI6862170.1 DsrE/DsrF/TusD sulfur relay family protein [Pseudothermotoga sp.]
MKITIQVMVPPYTYEDLDTALKIAEAAVEKGHEVNLFLFADSVLCINKNVKPLRIDRNIPSKIKEMIASGKIKVDICGICMDYRGITTDMIVDGANPSGLPELAELLATSDRFINLMA